MAVSTSLQALEARRQGLMAMLHCLQQPRCQELSGLPAPTAEAPEVQAPQVAIGQVVWLQALECEHGISGAAAEISVVPSHRPEPPEAKITILARTETLYRQRISRLAVHATLQQCRRRCAHG